MKPDPSSRHVHTCVRAGIHKYTFTYLHHCTHVPIMPVLVPKKKSNGSIRSYHHQPHRSEDRQPIIRLIRRPSTSTGVISSASSSMHPYPIGHEPSIRRQRRPSQEVVSSGARDASHYLGIAGEQQWRQDEAGQEEGREEEEDVEEEADLEGESSSAGGFILVQEVDEEMGGQERNGRGGRKRMGRMRTASKGPRAEGTKTSDQGEAPMWRSRLSSGGPHPWLIKFRQTAEATGEGRPRSAAERPLVVKAGSDPDGEPLQPQPGPPHSRLHDHHAALKLGVGVEEPKLRMLGTSYNRPISKSNHSHYITHSSRQLSLNTTTATGATGATGEAELQQEPPSESQCNPLGLQQQQQHTQPINRSFSTSPPPPQSNCNHNPIIFSKSEFLLSFKRYHHPSISSNSINTTHAQLISRSIDLSTHLNPIPHHHHRISSQHTNIPSNLSSSHLRTTPTTPTMNFSTISASTKPVIRHITSASNLANSLLNGTTTHHSHHHLITSPSNNFLLSSSSKPDSNYGAILNSNSLESTNSNPSTTVGGLILKPGDVWSQVVHRVIPLFNGEGHKGFIEDLNDFVSQHIHKTIADSPSKSISKLHSDITELFATGILILCNKLQADQLSDERLLVRVSQVWHFFFTGVLPYLEAIFLPLMSDENLLNVIESKNNKVLQERLQEQHLLQQATTNAGLLSSGSSSLLLLRQSNKFSSNQPRGPDRLQFHHKPSDQMATQAIDIRRLALIAFRDQLILPIFSRLYNLFTILYDSTRSKSCHTRFSINVFAEHMHLKRLQMIGLLCSVQSEDLKQSIMEEFSKLIRLKKANPELIKSSSSHTSSLSSSSSSSSSIPNRPPRSASIGGSANPMMTAIHQEASEQARDQSSSSSQSPSQRPQLPSRSNPSTNVTSHPEEYDDDRPLVSILDDDETSQHHIKGWNKNRDFARRSIRRQLGRNGSAIRVQAPHGLHDQVTIPRRSPKEKQSHQQQSPSHPLIQPLPSSSSSQQQQQPLVRMQDRDAIRARMETTKAAVDEVASSPDMTVRTHATSPSIASVSTATFSITAGRPSLEEHEHSLDRLNEEQVNQVDNYHQSHPVAGESNYRNRATVGSKSGSSSVGSVLSIIPSSTHRLGLKTKTSSSSLSSIAVMGNPMNHEDTLDTSPMISSKAVGPDGNPNFSSSRTNSSDSSQPLKPYHHHTASNQQPSTHHPHPHRVMNPSSQRSVIYQQHQYQQLPQHGTNQPARSQHHTQVDHHHQLHLSIQPLKVSHCRSLSSSNLPITFDQSHPHLTPSSSTSIAHTPQS